MAKHVCSYFIGSTIAADYIHYRKMDRSLLNKTYQECGTTAAIIYINYTPLPQQSLDILSHNLQKCDGVGINRTITARFFVVNMEWEFIIDVGT
jgi:hypothetical protein